MHRCCLAALLVMCAGGLSMMGGSYMVKPVRVELSTRQLRTTVRIQNLGDEPTTIQAHIVTWSARGAEEILAENDDILLNPPIFTVAAGHTQSLRLGLRHPPADAREGTYRLILEQVPGPRKPGFAGIDTLLKVSVPIFIKPRTPAPDLVWTIQRTSNEELRLAVENRGNAHVQIRKFALAASGVSGPGFAQDTATYVLQNARKEWLIRSGPMANAGKLQLQAQTDNGYISEDLVTSSP